MLIALARIEEIAAIAFGRSPRRLVSAPPAAAGRLTAPKVSIHIPAYREPPEMLKLTLDRVARLELSEFRMRAGHQQHARSGVLAADRGALPALLGERFKFVRAKKVEGFKAGALRLALERTAPDAEIIGILDADYVVQPDWLKDLAPLFADPKVGLIQAPQDHRDGDRVAACTTAMNGEYAGFFDIGMVQRNEAQRHHRARHHVPDPPRRR